MSVPLHRDAIGDQVHTPFRWTVADRTARLALTGMVESDLGKLAWQQDNDTFWALTGVSPVAWVCVGGIPFLAKGDILAGGANGEPVRVAAGAEGQVVGWDDEGNVVAQTVGSALQRQVFTEDGSFTVPAGVYELFPLVIGATGGGAGSCYATGDFAEVGCGGGPAMAIAGTLSVSPGEVIAISIGDPGIGGVAKSANNIPGNPGTAGGETSVGDFITIVGSDGGRCVDYTEIIPAYYETSPGTLGYDQDRFVPSGGFLPMPATAPTETTGGDGGYLVNIGLCAPAEGVLRGAGEDSPGLGAAGAGAGLNVTSGKDGGDGYRGQVTLQWRA